jgi:hypothetical protein
LLDVRKRATRFNAQRAFAKTSARIIAAPIAYGRPRSKPANYIFAIETMQRRSIDAAAASAERPDLSAFLRISLERFKSHLRTISNSRFRIILIWTYSNIPLP